MIILRQTCSDCLDKSSPYCAWDLASAACVSHAQVSWGDDDHDGSMVIGDDDGDDDDDDNMVMMMTDDDDNIVMMIMTDYL